MPTSLPIARITRRFLPVQIIVFVVAVYFSMPPAEDNTPVAARPPVLSVSNPLKKRVNRLLTQPVDTTQLKQSDWYRQVIEDIRQSEYEIQWSKNDLAYQGLNHAQHLSSSFTADKLVMRPVDGKDGWELALQLQHISADGNKVYHASASPVIECNKQEISFRHSDQFSVQYINDKTGVRENFIIEKRPAGTAGKIAVHIAVNKDWTIGQPHDKELHFAKRNGDSVSKKITYNSLKAWDAEQKELPATFVVGKDNEFSIEVNAAGAVYPVTIDPLSTTASWMQEGNREESLYGSSVGSAGDVNGDGFSDVIVGVPGYDSPTLTDAGRVLIYHGSATGLSTLHAKAYSAPFPSARTGASVGTAGDVNGDGFSDVIYSAPGYTNASGHNGRVFVIFGSSAGLRDDNFWIEENPEGGDSQFGASVATAGDVDGDGYSDVIIGAPLYTNEVTQEGKVYVYHGSPFGLFSTADWEYERDQPEFANLGYKVCSAGDVNGDGYSDIIVSANNAEGTYQQEGAIHVFHGSPAGLDENTPADWYIYGGSDGGYFGESVSAAGDVNGDGYGDILAGSPGYDNGSITDAGKATLYFGSASGITSVNPFVVEGSVANGLLGKSVTCAGDISADGYSDFMIGVPGDDGGKVQVYYGDFVGPTYPVAVLDVNVGQAGFGTSLASAGDINGDGFSDVIIGAPAFSNDIAQLNEGAAFVYTGSAEQFLLSTLWTVEGNNNGALLGQSMACAGDVNGDGVDDVIIGAPGYNGVGKVYVYYGSEYFGLRTPLNPSWVAEGEQPEAQFGYSVSGAGDVNGDGYDDIIVGAHFYDAGTGVNAGRVYIYHGSPAGLPASGLPDQVIEGITVDSFLGYSVASAGDVNADGYGDVLITEFGADRVLAYYGSSSGLVQQWSVVSPVAFSSFGQSIAGADVNGDGYGDVLIGAPNYSSNTGKVYAYYGGPTGLSTTLNWSAEGEQTASLFGNSVSAAGDVNGDGYGDIVIGAHINSEPESAEGKVYVYYGSSSGLVSNPSWTAQVNMTGAFFGISVASAGDVNSDGYADILIGSDLSDGQINEGAIYVYNGSRNGLPAAPSWSLQSDWPQYFFGIVVSGAGDVNGDGYSDILAASPVFSDGQTQEGRVYVYYANNPISRSRPNNLRLYNTDLSTPVANSNQSLPQFGAGLHIKSPIGRTHARLVWETRGQGLPFSHLPVTNSVEYTGRQPGFTDLGLAGTELKSLVTKQGRETKIRVRAEYSKATAITGQVYGPWRYVSGQQRGANGMGSAPLPLKLLSFSGKLVNAQPQLTWTTAGENNTSHFEVERSVNGNQFVKVAVVAASGSTSSNVTYDHNDPFTVTDKVWYRLKMMDEDGRFTYSPVIVLSSKESNTWSVFPNPAKQGQPLYLRINSTTKQTITIELTDMSGRMLSRRIAAVVKGSQVISFGNIPVSSGMYMIRVSGLTNMSEAKKLIVN